MLPNQPGDLAISGEQRFALRHRADDLGRQQRERYLAEWSMADDQQTVGAAPA